MFTFHTYSLQVLVEKESKIKQKDTEILELWKEIERLQNELACLQNEFACAKLETYNSSKYVTQIAKNCATDIKHLKEQESEVVNDVVFDFANKTSMVRL